LQKRIESSQLANAHIPPPISCDSPAAPSLANELESSCSSGRKGRGGFRFALGGATALAILTSLSFAPTAVAPQFHAEPVRHLPVARSRSSPADVSVRIWSLAPPPALRAVPINSTSRIRFCDSCQWIRPSSAIRAQAAGDRAELGAEDGSSSTIGEAEVSGAWRFESSAGVSAQSGSDATISASEGRLQVTLRMTMEQYVAGVLAAEARGFTSPESLKAMAVAIRTYATRFRGRHRGQSFDFCDSTHCQALHLAEAGGRFLAAARATAGEILVYDGKPATTYYHRDCGGTTEAAGILWRDVNVPYLKQQSDPYCTRQSHEGWNTQISQADLGRALTGSGIAPPPRWHGIEVVTRTPSGRARKLRLVGATNLLIASAALRLAVARAFGGDKVRSDLFAVRAEGSDYVFSGVGSGHGVGMCQAGAAEMGAEGKTYDDILSFYYPGTTLWPPSHNASLVSGN
jgi:SpoIID/LytB domain protein